MSPETEMENDLKDLKNEHFRSGLVNATIKIAELESEFKNWKYSFKGVQQTIESLCAPIEGVVPMLAKKVEMACTFGREASISADESRKSAERAELAVVESKKYLQKLSDNSGYALVIVLLTAIALMTSTYFGISGIKDKSITNLANQTDVMRIQTETNRLMRESLEQNKVVIAELKKRSKP